MAFAKSPISRPVGKFAARRGGRDSSTDDRAVGAGDGEHAVVELDVGSADLQHVRGDHAALVDDLVAPRWCERRAAQLGRARAEGAAAVDHLVGVACTYAPRSGIEAEPVAHQLLVDGLVALAVVVIEPENHGHRAGAVEAHLGRLSSARARRRAR